ncbi:MAG TPA: NfeD family protein, partial [Acidobacteriaceae bacterium]
GVVFVLTALYALGQFPIRPSALLLILSALTLIVLELKFPSHGVLTAAGIGALYFGVIDLIDSPRLELRIHPAITLALCTCFGVLTAILLRLALRAHHQKTLTGPAALVGYPAMTMEPIGPQLTGHILVQGEIWQAISTSPIAEKQRVRVTGCHEAVLKVEAMVS